MKQIMGLVLVSVWTAGLPLMPGAGGLAPSSVAVAAAPAATERAPRAITIPAGTVLQLRMATGVSSVGSRIEDAVQAVVSRSVVVRGVTVIPAGAQVTGYVADIARSGRVKGRARVGVRFNAVRLEDGRHTIRTNLVSRQAPATKKADATKIAIGSGAGAVVGALTGGKKGAAIGAAVGGAGGTGVVLATRGKEVALGRGTIVRARLAAPVTVRVK